MNSLLKKLPVVAAFVAALLSASPAQAADAADMPLIMSIKTNIYGYQGPDNSFTFSLGSTEKDCEFYVVGPKASEYIWVDPYTIGKDEDGSNAAIATPVGCSVTETNNVIQVYGDASKLDYIDVHGCYLSDIYLSPDLTNLSVIDLSHNELKAINLSNHPSLESIDLTDNEISVGANMNIGTNHPNLVILQVGINDAVDPNLDLKNFPKLQYFSGRNNYGITKIDPSGCPNLVSLVLEVTNITEIDVSKNLNLDVLNLSNTKVTNIDISKNTKLGEFYASHEGSYNSQDQYKLTSIDVSNNPRLQYLDLSGNKLTEIDLTHNTDLILLYLQKNRLSNIDLSKCTKLASVNLSNNLFTFATLPVPQPGWDYVYYRQPLECYFKYRVGETIDFSESVIRAPYQDYLGNTITPQTDAIVLSKSRLGEEEWIDPESGIYTYSDGKITFNQALPDSVYVKFTNSVFNDWDLDTRAFMIKTDEDYDAPSIGFSFTPYSSMNGQTLNFKAAASPVASGVSLPAQLMINVAGETVATVDVTTSTLPDANNVSFTMPATGGQVDLMITDGFGISALAMDGIKMSAIDLLEAENMYTLTLSNANLPSIDLSYNRGLRYLNLSNNLLGSIDLSPVRGDFEKWDLRDIDLSNNHLTSITVANSTEYNSLNLANNWFSNIDLKYYTSLTSLDLSGNRLTGELNLEKQEKLQNLNISGNQIESLVIGDMSNAILRNLKTLDVSNNNMSFATLPLPASVASATYTYAPQNKLNILGGGPSIDLSIQNVESATSYVWKYNDNNQAVPTNLFTITNGVTQFDESLVGKTLYCELTNTSFPDFATQPLTTTNFEVKDRPTAVVASFTPAESGNITIGFAFNTTGANAVYIDWTGEGNQYDPYIYDSANTAIYRSGTATAGKKAVVYTYGNPTEVAGIYINNYGEGSSSSQIKLTDFDATPMTNAQAIIIHNAGLTDGSIKLPASRRLSELVLDGNNFENQQFTDINGNTFTSLRNLGLANNKYTSFDLSLYPTVQFLLLADNQLTSIKMPQSNNSLMQLNAMGNKLENIDLHGLNALGELLLSDNLLSSLDVAPVKQNLRVLTIAGNKFTFATLPKLTEFNSSIFTYYDYFGQQPFTVPCVDGIVDLSDQHEIETLVITENGYEPQTYQTTVRWFLGDKQSDVYYDYNTEMFVGEELESPTDNPDDPEYTTYAGVTYFQYTQRRKVIGVLTNPGMPSLILYTTPLSIDRAASGVESVSTDSDANIPVDVYTLSGIRVRSNVLPAEATEGLTPGLYIVGNRKVLVR